MLRKADTCGLNMSRGCVLGPAGAAGCCPCWPWAAPAPAIGSRSTVKAFCALWYQQEFWCDHISARRAYSALCLDTNSVATRNVQ